MEIHPNPSHGWERDRGWRWRCRGMDIVLESAGFFFPQLENFHYSVTGWRATWILPLFPAACLSWLESLCHSVPKSHSHPTTHLIFGRKMRQHLILSLACVSLAMLWDHGCAMHVPRVYSISMDTGSGNGAEPDLLIPVDNPPVHIPPVNVPPIDVSPANVTPVEDTPFSPYATIAPTLADTITNSITTTMIRLKDFMLTRVVDFLQDNMLIIIVVTSLLIVMIFIICCAATMSQKRKMEAYKAPANSPGKNTDHAAGGVKPSSGVQSRLYSGPDSARRVQNQGTPKNMRTPSAALVGDKLGKEPKQKEVKKVREEEEDTRRVEPKPKAQKDEEGQKTPSPPKVCTCHLGKANH